MSKGSKPRPYSIPLEDYNAKWEAIFGKKNFAEEKKNPKEDNPREKKPSK